MENNDQLAWLRAAYRLHTFAYRDPRAAFSVATGLPVISPTAVLLGIVSTLYSIGDADAAQQFLGAVHRCRVAVDAPEGAVFFRAFHQLRRYETDKNDKNNPRLGHTLINQGVREYALVQGLLTLWVAVPPQMIRPVTHALRNRDHIGTHDSLCSLVGDVEQGGSPDGVIFHPPEHWQAHLAENVRSVVVTLSRFKPEPIEVARRHWHLAGGEDTELVPYLIAGEFSGTSNGKIFRKNPRS